MASTRNIFSPLKQREDDRDAAYLDFPKVFEKSFWENLDKRFTFILVATLLINSLIIAYFVANPPPRMNTKDLDRIQKQFARLVLDKTPEAEPETKFVENPALLHLTPEPAPAENTGQSAAGPIASRSSGAPSLARDVAKQRAEVQHLAASVGRRTREQITREVSRTGILGLLTSDSGQDNNEAVAEVLKGSKAPAADLNEALANVGQVKRVAYEEGDGLSGGGREVRGSRATNAGGIDALVQGLGEGKAKSVQRTGGFS